MLTLFCICWICNSTTDNEFAVSTYKAEYALRLQIVCAAPKWPKKKLL